MQKSVSDLTGRGGLRRIILGGLALVALWLNPGATQAQTNSVVSSNSVTALNAALLGGGTVVLTFDGTMTVTNPFTINEDNVVLEGNGRTISGGGTSRIFIVPSAITNFTVRNLNIINGKHTGANGGPGLKGNDGGSNGQSGSAGGPGGPGGAGKGGAILNQGTLVLQNCNLVTNNATAGNGGAGGAGGNSIFQGGNGGVGGAGGAAFGGAIFNDSGASLTLTNCSVLGNLTVGGNGGAGGTNGTGGTSLMGNGGAAGNAAGAGVYNNHGNVVIVNCAFAFNQGTGGNGATGGTTAQGNTGLAGTKGGDGLGGGICNVGDLSVTNSTFFHNTLAGGGGGNGGSAIFQGGKGGNGGGAYGGAIYNNSPGNVETLANCTLANSIISGGTNGLGGGGSTTGNHGSFGPSGGNNIANASGNFEMVNTILSNIAGLTNAFGTIGDIGGNISSDFTPKFRNSTLPNNKNLKLGSFTDNGGPTFTMALNIGSSAIDHGIFSDDVLPFDQRGLSRPVGDLDVGAFEFGNHFSISGQVFIGTNAGTNVTVTATLAGADAPFATVTTDANGNYSFAGLPANDYLLNATLATQPVDFFQPNNYPVTIGPQTNNINFVATNIFSISGTVTGGSNITVSVNGPMNLSTTTGTNGSYSITNLQAGSYTVAVTGQPFGLYQPTNYTVILGPSSTNNVNFAATGTNAINGRVMIGISGASNITVTANDFSTTTDGSGNYSFSNLVANSYTVVAQPAGMFKPSSYSIALAKATNNVNFALTNAATMQASNASDGTISVSVPAIPNQPYRIQSSTNISNPTNWVTLSTTNSGTNGLFNIILPTTDFTNQFFRAVTP